jgi:uncharacterized protein YkwD
MNLERTSASIACLLAASLIAACGGGSDNIAAPSIGNAASPPAPATSPAPAASGATCDLANFQADLMVAINNARRSGTQCPSGFQPAVPELAWDAQLVQSSEAHSKDMALTIKDLSHTGSDGSTFSDRMTRAGYAWSAGGENIAVGYGSAGAVMDGWLKSDGHCRNIMAANFKDVGVACVRGAWRTSSDAPYYTMNLGRKR